MEKALFLACGRLQAVALTLLISDGLLPSTWDPDTLRPVPEGMIGVILGREEEALAGHGGKRDAVGALHREVGEERDGAPTDEGVLDHHMHHQLGMSEGASTGTDRQLGGGSGNQPAMHGLASHFLSFLLLVALYSRPNSLQN